MKSVVKFAKNELARIFIGCILFAAAFVVERLEVRTVALILYVLALLVAGIPVFFDAVRGILRRDLLDEKFLMSIASIGAMIVGEWSEGVAVMLFFLVGEFFEHKAVARSRRSISSLMDICPDTANVLRDGIEELMDADEVEVGSVIVVRAGERVPIDSVVIDGFSDLDTSALTGESVPQAVRAGDEIKSGSVLINGVLKARTLRAADESAAARILELVENANDAKSREENFITKFSRIYTPVVVACAVLLAVIPSLLHLTEWSDSIYRALIFLVISCPCALVISVPLSFFGGIGCAASQGILFKGGNTFSPLAKAETVAFDKTGTLTTGEFRVDKVTTYGISESELLNLAASAEYPSNHPVSLAIKRAAANSKTPTVAEELAGRGVKAELDGAQLLVGNKTLMSDFDVIIPADSHGGVYVAKDGKLIGVISVSDTVKEEGSTAISELRALGVRRFAMISGDKKENAHRVSEVLGIDEAYAELLPEQKYARLEKLISEAQGSVVYVGDGINDAPSLARADVGVAMGGIGSDSAISAADLVLMSDDLKKLPCAVRIARKTLRIAKQNIIFALGIKLSILVLGALGYANMWLAVFADVGVAVLAILNAMRTLHKMK